MTDRLIFGWTEADLRAAFDIYNLDQSIIDKAFIGEVTRRVYDTMDKLYVLDAFLEVVQEVAREKATA